MRDDDLPKKPARRRTLAPVPEQQVPLPAPPVAPPVAPAAAVASDGDADGVPIASNILPFRAPLGRLPVAPETTEQRERRHEAAAKATPLALAFQLVGCQLARPLGVDGGERVIPTGYEFSVPCVRGYDAPNQECRTCGYCVIRPVGEAAAFQNRYHGHGLIIPVTEEQADAIVDGLDAQGTHALKRPVWEDHFERQRAAIQRQHEDEARARQLERQQAGPFGGS